MYYYHTDDMYWYGLAWVGMRLVEVPIELVKEDRLERPNNVHCLLWYWLEPSRQHLIVLKNTSGPL